MKKLQQEYRSILTDIAHLPLSKQEAALKEEFTNLVGLQILIDIEENPGLENYDPLFFEKTPQLLTCIGHFLYGYSKKDRSKWGSLILVYIRELFEKYYRTQINFDLEDIIADLQRCSNDIDSQADRELENRND